MKIGSLLKPFFTGVIFIVILGISQLNGQNIGVNTDGSAPDGSAILDIKSTSAGLLIPRVSLQSLSDETTISDPANSLLVFNTNASVGLGKGFYYNDGTSGVPVWVPLLNKNNSWLTGGNAGTTPGTHFLGTTDEKELYIKTNNVERLRISKDGGLSDPTVSITSLSQSTSALDIVANTLTNGSAITLSAGSGDGPTEDFSFGLNINKYGTNTNSKHASIGFMSAVTNSGVDSRNVGGAILIQNAFNAEGINLTVEGVNSSTEQQLTGNIIYMDANSNSNINSASRGIQILNYGSATNYGMDIAVADATYQSYGILVSNSSTATQPSYGIKSTVSGGITSSTADQNYGGYFSNSSTSNRADSWAYGMRSEATGSTSTGVNCGAFFSAANAADGKNYALIVPHYNSGSNWGGWVGIGTITPKRLMHVDGIVRIGGDHNIGVLEFVKTGTSNPTVLIAGNNASTIKYMFPSVQATTGQLLQCATIVGDTAKLAWGSLNSISWSLVGNTNTTPGTDFIGNTDAKDLYFKTNNIERMRIISSGNVGITNGNLGVGTNTPSSLLHVAGTGQFGTASTTSGELKLFNSGSAFYTSIKSNPSANVSYTLPSTDGTSGQLLKTDGSGNLAWITGGTVALGGTGQTTLTTNGVLYGNGTSAVGITAQGASGTVLHGNGGVPSFSAVVTADIINANITQPKLQTKAVVALTDASATLSASDMIDKTIFTITPTSARTLTTETAANLVAGMSGAGVGSWFEFTIINLATTSGRTATLSAGSGVTIVGSRVCNIAASDDHSSSATFIAIFTNITGGSQAVSVYRK